MRLIADHESRSVEWIRAIHDARWYLECTPMRLGPPCNTRGLMDIYLGKSASRGRSLRIARPA